MDYFEGPKRHCSSGQLVIKLASALPAAGGIGGMEELQCKGERHRRSAVAMLETAGQGRTTGQGILSSQQC